MSHHDHHDHFDEFYAGGHKWSGNPNEALLREAETLTPGTALDIGCGEGADAVWLAERGWKVTAFDPAQVAVARSKDLAAERGVPHQIRFLHTTLEDFLDEVGEETYDLVTGFYLPLSVSPQLAERIVGLLAPGGTLLCVDHDWDGTRPERTSPEEMVSMIADLVSQTAVTRSDRTVTHGAGARHKEDIILRAVR